MTASNDEHAQDSDPFFPSPAHEVVGRVMSWLNSTHPGRWDPSDVVRLPGRPELITQVLAHSGEEQSSANFDASAADPKE